MITLYTKVTPYGSLNRSVATSQELSDIDSSVNVIRVDITGDDVLLAWQQYCGVLPWPLWAAFHPSDVGKDGREMPTRIVWFGDDAKFAIANWRHEA